MKHCSSFYFIYFVLHFLLLSPLLGAEIVEEPWETQVYQETSQDKKTPELPSTPSSNIKFISPLDEEFFAEIDHLGTWGKTATAPTQLPEVQKEDLIPDIYYGVIKANTIVRQIHTNEHFRVGRTLLVRAQREKFNSTNAYLLDHGDLPLYEVLGHEIRSITADIDLLPQPKEYQEYKVGRKFYHPDEEVRWTLDLILQYQALYLPYYQSLSGVDSTEGDASALNGRVMFWSNPHLLYGLDLMIQNGEVGNKAPFFTWAHYFLGPALRYVVNPKEPRHLPKYHLFCSYQQSFFSQGHIEERAYRLNANFLNLALEMTFQGQWSDLLIGVSRKYLNDKVQGTHAVPIHQHSDEQQMRGWSIYLGFNWRIKTTI